MLGPMMNDAFLIGFGSSDIRSFGAVVEGLSRNVGKVPETIPLCSTLGIHIVQVIVCYILHYYLYGVLELLPSECRLLWHIQW